MRNSKEQREAARQHCIRMNAKATNPFRDPEKQGELSMRVWNNPKKKAEVLRKRKYKPGFKGEAFVWKGREKTEEQKVKYREFSKAKEELNKLAQELDVEIDIRKLDKEQTQRVLESLKKLPR